MNQASPTDRVYNFSAGPAALPVRVLEKARDELVSLPGLGMSVLEISHRSQPYEEINAAAIANLRKLLSVPDNYKILFVQGGARLQFAMVPMNLLRGQAGPASFLLTGSWGKKAIEEAQRVGETHVAWDGKSTNYDRLPTGGIDLPDNAAYLHITSNETIQGVQFAAEPACGNVPLVCDASSDFLCRPVPINRYGLIYACAQKNAGPAGVTVVIMREDLLQRSGDDLSGYLDYRNHAKHNSLYNTPPAFAVYCVNLVTRWLLDDIGGIEKMHDINQRKATMLYEVIDQSDGFYQGHAQTDCRSIMNVTFRLPSDELQAEFLEQSGRQGLCSLKGHRSVGGIRASIYNAMPIEGVQALRDFMRDFLSSHKT
jgi:phosphoserine aminotransferase